MPGTYPIDQQRPILGRHVHHDPKSRRFPYTRGAAGSYRPPAIYHKRYIPIFDQSYREVGSCTADTGLGLLGTGPYWAALTAAAHDGMQPTSAGPYPLTEDGVLALYSDITANDPFDGAYPPDDTGSDGLSMAQALQRAGIIPGYQHTFTLGDALRALANFPLGVGTVWTDSMFYPSSAGLVKPRGDAVGGHEWILDEYVPGRDWVGGTTSWGTGFGVGGRFYLTVADFGSLLDADGDVIVLTPTAAPPPPPQPEPGGPTADADAVLADAFETWRAAKGM